MCRLFFTDMDADAAAVMEGQLKVFGEDANKAKLDQRRSDIKAEVSLHKSASAKGLVS